MSTITCIIVEDEPVSQEILKRYIADHPQLELKAVCSNAIEASAEVRNHAPDLIFLDITLPKISGLDFYKSLTDPPFVIFTTAYPEYAVSGFEVDAVDYLVKPFPFERFLKAVNKLQDLVDRPKGAKSGFIMLSADKKIHKVSFDNIFYLEAMGDYVKVHTSDKTLVVHQTLQKLSEQLPPASFYRIHKSFLIAFHRIDYIEGNMVIIGKSQIPIGQTYRNEFLTALNKNK
jgi:DNA-binding LytR/AlgR family response regulator